MRIDVRNKDAYEVVANLVFEYFGYWPTAIVDLYTENAGQVNALILPETIDGPWIWWSDWYEGGDWVEVNGMIDIYAVDIPSLDEGFATKFASPSSIGD